MKDITIHTGRNDTTTHRAVIENHDLEWLIASHVAKAAGVDIDAEHVRAQCHVRSTMGNYGSEVRAEVTITVDHAKQDSAADDSGKPRICCNLIRTGQTCADCPRKGEAA